MTEKVNNDYLKSMIIELKDVDSDLRVHTFLLLQRFADAMNKYTDIEAAKIDMTTTKIAVVAALVRRGGFMPQKDIAREVLRSKQAVTRVIDNLEKQELAKRGLVDKDRRIRHVITTKKGLDRIKETIPRRLQLSYRALSCLSEEEVGQLTVILEKLMRHILGQIATDSG